MKTIKKLSCYTHVNLKYKLSESPFLASANLRISEEDNRTVARWSEPSFTDKQNDFVYYDVVLKDEANQREFFSKMFKSGL